MVTAIEHEDDALFKLTVLLVSYRKSSGYTQMEWMDHSALLLSFDFNLTDNSN